VNIIRLSVAGVWLLGLAASPGAAQDPPAEPLTLRDAVRQALARSPQLTASQDARETAAIQRQAAAARFAPRISPILSTGGGSAGPSQQDLGIGVSQLLPSGAQIDGSVSSLRYGAGPGSFRDAGYMIGVSQPLLRGFGVTTRAEKLGADRAVQSAARGAEDARQQLILAVAQVFFTVVRQQRLVAETQRALERAIRLGEMSEARARVGLSTELDVLRAGLLRSQAQAAAFRDRDALEAAREDLNILVGRPADEPFTADDTIDLGSTGPSSAAEDTIARQALSARPDVRAAREHLTDLEHAASIARWNLLPQINLDVAYTHRTVGDPAAGLPDPLNGWRVGMSTSYTFDRSVGAAAAGLADVAVRSARRSVTEAEQRAVVDVRRALRAVARANDVIGVLRNSLDLARQQSTLAAMRFERGLADNLEVVDAETSVFQAQTALIGAELDRAMSVLYLQRATGALNPSELFK
jgi:outer membrane protein